MRTTIWPAYALATLVTTGAAQAPTKLAGKMECAAPNPSHVLPVADTGTCKGTFRPDGKAAWDIKGDYRLATPAGK